MGRGAAAAAGGRACRSCLDGHPAASSFRLLGSLLGSSLRAAAALAGAAGAPAARRGAASSSGAGAGAARARRARGGARANLLLRAGALVTRFRYLSQHTTLVCLLSICSSHRYYIYMFRRPAVMEYDFW